MAQLHCYVPDRIAEKIQQKARQSHLSVSKYIAELLKQDAAGEWPNGYLENVLGHWQGGLLEREPEGDLESRPGLS